MSTASSDQTRRLYTYENGWPYEVCLKKDRTLDHRLHGGRDAGPTYPILVVDEFAGITFVEDCGCDDQTVTACAPEDLPRATSRARMSADGDRRAQGMRPLPR